MRYLIGALVVLALLFLVWWLFSRSKQQKLEQQRAEAAGIRAAAEERGAALRGQEAFAQQAGERASVARHEAEERARRAEESAREAQRAEAEARRHQDELERARLEHDAELRRADELDPDVVVDKDDPRPLPEDLDDHVRPLDEPAGRDSSSAVESGAPLATGAGAAVIGSAYAASRGDVSDEQAQRLASGVDYAGDAGDAGDADEGVPGARPHHGAAMAEDSTGGSTDRVQHAERQGPDMTPDDDGTTRDVDETRGTDEVRGTDDVRSTDDTSDGLDATDDTTRDSARRDPAADDSDMMIINDVENYASTEPLPMDEQTPAEQTPAEQSDDSEQSDVAERSDDRHDQDADRPGSDDSRDRSEGGDATHWPDGTDRVNTLDDSEARASDPRAPGTGSGGDEASRRTSEVEEIRDGGYGVGSAAPFEDRAQPRDHPVQAYRDTMTYRIPGGAGYDSAEPDVWFYDEDTARRAGFKPSES